MSEPSSTAPAIDVRALRRVLDRLAQAEEAPWLNQEVARRMADRLPVIKQAPAHWLDWWAFTGAGGRPVSAVWPLALRKVVEPTQALVLRSERALRAPWWVWGQRRQQAAQPVWLEAEVPDGEAQMLWANLVLHTSEDVPAKFAQWQRALAVDGFLMFSTFGPDTLRELRAVFSEQGWPAPHPPYIDMHDLGDMLVHSGFADPVMDQETLQLSWSGPEAALAELRSLGGHLGFGRSAGLRTPRWRARLLGALAERAGADGRIHMRFELVYGHAYKPVPKPASDGVTIVSLESLRAKLPKRNS